MITIEFLKKHPETIPQLAKIWHEALGKAWVPDEPVSNIFQLFHDHLDDDVLPLTLVASENNTSVGMCSLRLNGGIRSDLKPWLSSLAIDPMHQKKGIGKKLIDAIKGKAKEMGYPKLYLVVVKSESITIIGDLKEFSRIGASAHKVPCGF